MPLGLAACAPGLPEPSITGVDPAKFYNGDEIDLVVTGEHFYPQVELDVRDAGGRLDRQFDISLESDDGSYSLEGVELLDYEHLQASVPTGLPAARYTVVVTTPMDDLARLPRGVTITNSRAENFEVTTEGGSLGFQVKDEFELGLELYDTSGELLLQAVDVNLNIVGTPRSRTAT